MHEREPKRAGQMEHLAEAELGQAVLTDPDLALPEVVRRYSGDMFALACRTAGASRADDAVQEVMLRLLRQPESYIPSRGSLRTFLMMQTRARAIDMGKRLVAQHPRAQARARGAHIVRRR